METMFSFERRTKEMTAADRGGALSVDASGCVVLDRQQCLDYLSAGGLGRIAVNVGALPAILPVQFALHDEEVVFSVGAGTVLHRATRDAVVAFESDGVEPDGRRQWSVAVTGIARHLTEDGNAGRSGVVAQAWAHLEAPAIVAISTVYLSGRRTV
jgi:nitroimidazol reductase NimA-like FMN-containing flavoprotein (pyridoxamine 5'-phosphate oxidase superfamily)